MDNLQYFAIPAVPEISLIFEKPTARNLNNGSSNSSASRSFKPTIQLSDNTVRHTTSTSPIVSNPSSYAAWREQNYTKQINPATSVSPSCKNTYGNNHMSQPRLQDVSIQTQQKQDKICDMEKKIISKRANDEICEKSVQFRRSNMNNCYDEETQLSLSNKKHLPYNSVQRAMYNVPDCAVRMPSEVIPETLKKTEHLQIPHTAHQQFYAPNYSNHNVDNNETVKTLLQLVNSQSEQIRTLQLQVDRLVRMQEENYRNISACPCSYSLSNQVFRHPPINCYDSTFSSSIAQSQNQGTKKNTSSEDAVAEKKDVENFGENNKLLEQQSKKAFVEQKVSIGVMTSFEFTVQNSPFLIDSSRNDVYEKQEVHRENNRKNAISAQDTTESVQRYKNTFTRKPGAQLENIVEDSESYLSSSQQQSSNYNASSYMKDSERYTPKQPDLYNVANTSESLKIYPCLATDLNQKKVQGGMYIGENSDKIDEMQNSNKMLTASMNVNHSPAESANYSKALSNINDYSTINGEDSTNKMNKHPLRNIHSPVTDYYRNHRNKEHCHNNEQTKDIGDSMILNGGDLKIFERPPTPEPSIHVEMQEYPSDDESDKQKRTSKIGWTFYNNVLGQVNEILQNSSITEDKDHDDNAKIARKIEQVNDTETRAALNTVKAATLKQLRKLGISLTDNNEHKESNGYNKAYVSIFYLINFVYIIKLVNSNLGIILKTRIYDKLIISKVYSKLVLFSLNNLLHIFKQYVIFILLLRIIIFSDICYIAVSINNFL